jgi:anaerobic selenocysteine-containing dehydrogenase
VDRYLERTYHAGRLTTPLRRAGPKGSGQFEPVTWEEALDEIATRVEQIIAQSGPEVCLFSSDYPHVEGGRRPIERFEASLAGTSEAGRRAFYHGNFEDLMGRALQHLPAA